MISFYLILVLCIISFLPSINAQNAFRDEDYMFPVNLTRNVVHNKTLSDLHQKPGNVSKDSHYEDTSDSRSWRIGHGGPTHHRPLKFVHGVVNIIGWGVLLPIGVITTRYFRKLPLFCPEWYSLHILSQISGFLIGTLGWGLGIALHNASKLHAFSTHGILGTIIFTFAAVQLLAICLQPNEAHKCRKYWVIYHRLLGYALIVLIIANIFEGFNNQIPAARRWRWFYAVILGVLAVIALALEVHKWIINRNSSSIYTIKWQHSANIS